MAIMDDVRPFRVHQGRILPSDIMLNVLFELDGERHDSRAPWFHTDTILQPTLFALCLLDKRWNGETTRLLYKDVFLNGSDTLSQFSRTLQVRKDLCGHVRSFFFTRSPDEDGEKWRSYGNAWDIEKSYLLCHNVRCERLMHTRNRLQSGYVHMPEGRWKDLGADKITYLELRSFGSAELFKSEPDFPVLEHLIIRDAQLNGEGVPACRWPVMPRLRRLCLYQCMWEGKRMSLPQSLRALEIIGGIFKADNFEDEIISVGKSLELLTIMPMVLFAHSNSWLCELPSVVTLRISLSLFAPMSAIHVPPRLRHLVVFKMSWDYFSDLHQVLEWVERLVAIKRSGTTDSYARTIRFVGPQGSSPKSRQEEVAKAAGVVGITLSLVTTRARHFDVEEILKGINF